MTYLKQSSFAASPEADKLDTVCQIHQAGWAAVHSWESGVLPFAKMLIFSNYEMFSADSIYVQVFSDRFVVKNVDTDHSLVVDRNLEFASPRMLIADFTMAEYELKAAVKSLRRGMFAPAPQILMHPMEQIEGGFTQVEDRVFRELAFGAGASKAAVHVGPILSGESIKLAIREYNHGKR